ncbi:MAG: hypothetical protein V4670_00080 [Bacteroidota bacterium]
MNLIYFGIIVLFGLFLIWSSFMMFFKPEKVKTIIAMAGSTYFINYTELITRVIIGFALIKVISIQEFIYDSIGYFLIITAVILMLLPIKLHNKFSVKAAEKLKPVHLKICAPISLIMGILVIFGIL